MGGSPRDRTRFSTGPCASLPIHTRRHLYPAGRQGGPVHSLPPSAHPLKGRGARLSLAGPPVAPPPPPAWSWVFTQKVEWAGVARAEALALGLGLGVDKALSRPPLRGPERPRRSAEPRAHKCSVHPGCGWGKATSLRSACLGLTVPPAPHSALQVTQTGLGEVGRRGSRDPGLRARALLFRGGGEAQLHRSTEDVVHGGGAWCARPRRL